MLKLNALLLTSLALGGCCCPERTAQPPAATNHGQGSAQVASQVMPVQVKHTVCFEKGSAALPANLADSVVPHSRHLIVNPYTRVLIEGMANDADTFEDKIALGQRRAEAVKNAIISLGVDPEQLIVRSSADLRPQSEQKPEMTRCVVLSY